MINGLNYDLTTDQLKEHFAAREKHHLARAQWYQEQADNLKSGDFEAVRSKMSSYSSNPVEDMINHSKKHQKLARQFVVMAKYLIANETYRLSEREMEDLEFYE